jgi:predicted O-methyltransferase YrrM
MQALICYDAGVKSLVRLLRWRLGLVKIAPWADPEETQCLTRYAVGKHRLAEIGVWEGGTTRMLRSVMSPDGVLFAIDPFPHGRLGFSYQRPIARAESRRTANGQVIWIRDTGAAAARDARVAAAPFDFVFIDSDHSFEGLRTDWEAWKPLASDIIALHDVIGPPEIGSVRFAQEHIFTDARFVLCETAGSLAILKRAR